MGRLGDSRARRWQPDSRRDGAGVAKLGNDGAPTAWGPAMSREFDAIQDALTQDSRAVWRLLRRFLCSRTHRLETEPERVQLIQDLLLEHPGEMAYRLALLAEECPGLSSSVIAASVIRIRARPAMAGFNALRGRLDDASRGTSWWIQASEFGQNADLHVSASNRDEAIEEARRRLGRDAIILRVSKR